MTFRDITVPICLDVETATLEALKGYPLLHLFNVVAKRQELAQEFRNALGVADWASSHGARYILCEAGFQSPHAVALREYSSRLSIRVEFVSPGFKEAELFVAMWRVLEDSRKAKDSV